MKRETPWQISSFSGGQDSCVETRRNQAGDVEVRHSKRRESGAIAYTTAEWHAFLEGVKAGEFDHLAD